MDSSTRICIVGAGAAGLAAAHMLNKQGYRRVTVFESSARVGGKCHTIEHAGRTYELGAGIHTNGYHTVSEIMKDVGISSRPVHSWMYVDLEAGTYKRVPRGFDTTILRALGTEGPRLLAQLIKHRRLFRPGFAGLDRALCQPFATWARRHRLDAIAHAVRSVHTGFGYGYYEEVPAAYVLKYMTLMRPPREYLDVGYQGLWQRVAQALDVRLATEVIAVARDDVITVTTATASMEFDHLILACPLDEAMNVIDATAEEKELFSRIRYYDYHVYAAFTENLPEVRYGFIPNARPTRTMFWYRRWKDTNLVIFYGLGRSSVGMTEVVDHETIRSNIEEDVRKIGARITRHHVDTLWKYFPHVSSEDMANGYYERLEALQGKNNTFYTGELLNFSTVETVSAYSKHLVKEHFSTR